MSQATNVATITYPGSTSTSSSANLNSGPAVSLPFSVARLSPGTVLDRTVIELEELVTPGVDGRRWRNVRSYFPSFQMETWADAPNYSAGVDLLRKYTLAQGQFVTLLWSAGNYTGQYFLVKVIDVQPKLAAGVLCGLGADANSGAIIRALWTLCVQAVENVPPSN
jgi:hypothetical protein